MRRVVVVEHHPQVLNALADLVAEEPGLELAGTADNVLEAISLVGRLRPDVVLIDMDEPNWKEQRLDRLLAELNPLAMFVHLTNVTDLECLESLENAPRRILTTAIPDFLRSLTK